MPESEKVTLPCTSRHMLKYRFATLLGFIGVSVLVYSCVVSNTGFVQFMSSGTLEVTPRTIREQYDSWTNETFKKIQEVRRQRVNDTCRRYPLRMRKTIRTKDLLRMAIDDERKLMFCYIPKVASTNWKVVLEFIGREFQSAYPHLTLKDYVGYKLGTLPGTLNGSFELSLALDYTEEELQYRLKNYFKIMIVRHPLVRLLSAYKHKFNESGNDDNPFKDLARTIIEKYRGPQEKKVCQTDVTFSELAQWVWYMHENKKQQNPHWESYEKLCHPCAVQYDFIALFENLQEESEYILKLLHPPLAHLMDVSEIGPSSHKRGRRPNTRSTVKAFYDTLSETEFQRIQEVYRVDCEMFGYDCNLLDDI